MILQGDLKDFSLPDALQLLLQQRKTGVLGLTRGKETAELFISQGNIIGVRIDSRTPENRMQEMLVESGRVSQRDMAELEAMSRDMDRPVLSTLTAKGILSDEQRETWFQMVAEDMVCDLFSWAEGRYAFSTTQKSLPHALSALRLSTEFTCMEGMRRVDEWPRLKEALPHDGVAFQATGRPPASELGEWEALVLGAIDGRRSLVQIGRLVPFGAFRLYECTVNLWKAGCIEPLGETQGRRAEPLPLAQQSDRDQKTAMMIGVAALCLVGAVLFRLAGEWKLRQSGAPEARIEARVRADLVARNAYALLLLEASATGTIPDRIDALVRRGMLTVSEAAAIAGARLRYEKSGRADFEFRRD